MFHNREDAARQLAQRLKDRQLHDPLVLAIPRGGVVTGAVLARKLGAKPALQRAQGDLVRRVVRGSPLNPLIG
jgi:predicted phosphoribosyltransferase